MRLKHDRRFAPTRIAGVSRSLDEETRGVYFCTAITPPRRIWGQPGQPNFHAAVCDIMGDFKYTDADQDEAKALADWAKEAIKKVRSRSRERKIPFNLTVSALEEVMERQGRRCALTGCEFDLGFSEKHSRRPFAPSVDRLDVSKGYLIGNFRITTVIANLARQDFGDGVFLRMCAETAQNKNLLCDGTSK